MKRQYYLLVFERNGDGTRWCEQRQVDEDTIAALILTDSMAYPYPTYSDNGRSDYISCLPRDELDVFLQSIQSPPTKVP